MIQNQISIEELANLIKKSVREELQILDFKNKEPPYQKFLTINDCAKYIHKAIPTLYKLVEKRKIPHIKQSGKIYFLQEDIDKWLMQGRKTVQ